MNCFGKPNMLLGNAVIYDEENIGSNGSFTEWNDARSDNFTFGEQGKPD
jgi:hypothetical protein